MKFNTQLLHGGFPKETYGSTLPPIYQVSAFECESAEKLEQVFDGKAFGYAYSRISNPTVRAFEKRIAVLEGGADAVSCSSGMAAVSMSLLNILKSGDEIIAGSGLFGGTLDLLEDLKAFGIRIKFVEHITAAEIESAATPATRAVFAELIGNPMLDVVDIQSVADAAQKNGFPLILDATTATSALVKPIMSGAHIVIHSSSKYINGSGDAISGIIVDSGRFKWDFDRFPMLAKYKKFGRLAYSVRLRQDIWRNFGACLSPQNAFLNCVGLETMGIRMERMCGNALELAGFLSTMPDISVNYPGLPDNAYYPLIEKQMNGGMGGAIFTLRTGTRERAFALMNNLRYACIATNIGDVRTLVIHPASTIYAHADDAKKQSAGVYDDLIRVSVGLEDIEDLKEDFARAVELIEKRGEE